MNCINCFLGVPANEIHVCGDLSAVPLVRQLCRQMGETLEVKQYERFTPLLIDDYGLPEGYEGVQAGDCIVAFSRREIFDIKKVRDLCVGWTQLPQYNVVDMQNQEEIIICGCGIRLVVMEGWKKLFFVCERLI